MRPVSHLSSADNAGLLGRDERISRAPAGTSVETPLKDEPARYHIPVLVEETIELLCPSLNKTIVDATLGGGGHSRALLQKGATVIGIDQDPDAVAFALELLGDWDGRFQAARGNFRDVNEILERLGVGKVDGALLDLGISSRQVDSAERGFSFQRNGPLDMRMDQAGQVTAADLVNNASAEQLEAIFRNFGEEPAARRLAGVITRERLSQPFRETLQLARVVEKSIGRHGKTHPATRVFQALRIAVNRELEALGEGLEQLAERLTPGGRLAVITFQSLEDRIVKTFFKTRSAEWIDRPEWPEARKNPERMFKQVTRKPIVATEQEQKRNVRARSAKLRVVEKL